MYIRCSEDTQDVFWTYYVRSTYFISNANGITSELNPSKFEFHRCKVEIRKSAVRAVIPDLWEIIRISIVLVLSTFL